MSDIEFYKMCNKALSIMIVERGKLISRLQKKLRRKNKKSAKQHQALSQWKINWREMQK